MKIGVTSDTHSLKIPEQLVKDFRSVDLIVHAGDFCTLRDVEVFSKLGAFKAVHGNMDEEGVRRQYPSRLIFTCEGIKIGLTHGRGSQAVVLETAMQEFKKDQLDIVIFGHSHTPMNETIRQTLYFNPGSPNDTVGAPYCSYGLIDINKGKIAARIIKVK